MKASTRRGNGNPSVSVTFQTDFAPPVVPNIVNITCMPGLNMYVQWNNNVKNYFYTVFYKTPEEIFWSSAQPIFQDQNFVSISLYIRREGKTLTNHRLLAIIGFQNIITASYQTISYI